MSNPYSRTYVSRPDYEREKQSAGSGPVKEYKLSQNERKKVLQKYGPPKLTTRKPKDYRWKKERNLK